MNSSEYRADPRMNASTLVHGCHSMKRLRRMMLEGSPAPTPDMEFGTAVHCGLLEPEKFAATYVVMPRFQDDPENVTQAGKRTSSTATTYYKQRVAEFEAESDGKVVMSASEHERLNRVIDALRDKPGVIEIVNSCEREKPLFGEIEGVSCKSRFDLIKRGYFCDLKTSRTVEQISFGRTFANLNYDFKLSFYRELANQNGYKIKQVQVIAQETSGDYDTVIYDVPDIVLDNALSRVRKVLFDYKQCLETGVWPGVDGGAESVAIVVPSWAMGGMDEMDWSGVEEQTEEVSYY